MTRFLFTLFLFCSLTGIAQDWSSVGKSIIFSDTLKNAAKYNDIDKALEHPEQVVYLDIYSDSKGDNINKFFTNADKFKSLRKLVLLNRIGPVIPVSGSIWTLEKLEYLDLCNFPGSSAAGIKNLKRLKYLALDGFGFSEFPAEVLELSDLEYLNLSCNFLSSLPVNIDKLKKLREIELTNNCFTKIPSELSGITTLTYITINNAEQGRALADGRTVCNNSITEFPSVFQNLTNLKKVNCFFKVNIAGDLKKKIKSSYPKIKFS